MKFICTTTWLDLAYTRICFQDSSKSAPCFQRDHSIFQNTFHETVNQALKSYSVINDVLFYFHLNNFSYQFITYLPFKTVDNSVFRKLIEPSINRNEKKTVMSFKVLLQD